MKILLIGVLSILSLSAFAEVCEMNVVLSEDASKLVVYLEDRKEAKKDDELVLDWIGGNPKKLNCDELIVEIKKSGKKSFRFEDQEIPVQLVHTISL